MLILALIACALFGIAFIWCAMILAVRADDALDQWPDQHADLDSLYLARVQRNALDPEIGEMPTILDFTRPAEQQAHRAGAGIDDLLHNGADTK